MTDIRIFLLLCSHQSVMWQSSGSCQAVRKNLFFIQNSKQTLPEWTKAKTPMRTSEIRRSIFLGENSGKLKENSGKLWTNSGIFFSSNHCEEYGVLEVQSLDPKRSCASMHRSQNKFWLGVTKMFGCSFYFFLCKSTFNVINIKYVLTSLRFLF